ncbi:MAG: cytochrome P450 [Verrucomicrobiae bacterium]|nr:cytochrome P450 [Verrucomicrobiae bacterium]
MTLSTGSAPALPPFSPFAPGSHADPYPAYQRYREQDPVHWAGPADHSGPGAWYLFSHAGAMSALKSHNLIQTRMIQAAGPLGAMLGKWMLFRNPPDHTRLRSLVSKAFSPQMAERLRPKIQETADFLLDSVKDKGEMDLMLHYASPLPLIVISELLGVPADDRELLRRWTIDIVPAIDFSPSREALMKATQGCGKLMEYLQAIIVERRKGPPKEDLISALIAAEEQDDRLSEEELISMCALLLGAGHETTVNLIGNGSYALLQHPEQLALLRDDPECVETAVEELLRYDSPVQMAFREVAEPFELGGKLLRKGEQVIILLGSANRDPEPYPEPNRLDLRRSGPRHAAFGMGIHFCLGSHLARLEARAAFRSLAVKMPNLALQPVPIKRREGTNFRGLETLPVSF